VHPVLHVGSVAHDASAHPTLPLQFESTIDVQLSVVGKTAPVQADQVRNSPCLMHVCVPSLHAPTWRVCGSTFVG
jgi:hypothetical protein